MTADLPAPLLAYFGQRENARAEAVAAFLGSLTERERALFHDAAVMGYVQGLMRDRSEGVPKDSQTMALVVDACFAFPDLYPAVNAAVEEQRSTVEYFVQAEQPDGTWEQCSGTSPDLEFVMARRDARLRVHPEFEFRIARRTTTTLIEIAKEEPRG